MNKLMDVWRNEFICKRSNESTIIMIEWTDEWNEEWSEQWFNLPEFEALLY